MVMSNEGNDVVQGQSQCHSFTQYIFGRMVRIYLDRTSKPLFAYSVFILKIQNIPQVNHVVSLPNLLCSTCSNRSLRDGQSISLFGQPALSTL